MWTLVLLLLFMFLPVSGSATTVTTWEVQYSHAGDVGSAKFYPVGTYEFMGPQAYQDYTTVYLEFPPQPGVIGGTWHFLGFYDSLPAQFPNGLTSGGVTYGVAALPDGFPSIVFPTGMDSAHAIPHMTTVETPPAPIAVPEPMTLGMVLVGVAFIISVKVRM